MGIEAWITSAVDDKVVNKAITLAGSLKRVRTAKKLVVLTTLAVTEELREKLKEVFDLVLLLEQKFPNGLNLDDYAKVQAFSLMIFDKCVYLSPNALVLKNCDEMFAKYGRFAALHYGPANDVDPSIYLYVPSLDYSRALGKVAHYVDSVGGADFPKYFNTWMKSHVPKIEKLDEQYNLRLNLKGAQRSLNSNASIVNFVDIHPLDCPEEMVKKTADEIGAIEKFAVDHSWNIFMEDVKSSTLDLERIFLKDGYKKEPIAIVGMSFRLPGANNVDEFWSLLAEGRDALVPVPPFRWTKEHSIFPCYDRKVEAGFLNVPLDEFDAKFFALSPKEAEQLDPQQRMLMQVSWEALEDAMIDPMKLRGTKTGVFVGSWIYDYKDVCNRAVDVDFFRTYMGNSIALTAARLSHFFETTGPSIATESGCSSAIAAVDLACKSLRNRDSEIAIAGGVNLLVHPFEQKTLEHVVSPDYRCKTFDASANGFARAEACATLVLKRLSDAVKDGDDIWGLIRGTALTQEGISKSLGTPTVHCESMAMQLALQDAGVDPLEISYIEAHGTGTAVGDPMEMMAIQKAYSNGRTEPVIIGSVKTNVGHTESVSGITGIIKVLLSMKNELIPKHLNLETLNPAINLDAIPAQIPLSPVPWPRSSEKRRIAGVSSFGISGTDGHAIVEEPPVISQPSLEFKQERPLHIMKISAKSNDSMDDLVQRYLQLFKEKLEQGQDEARAFADIAHSANVGRVTFNNRLVVVAGTLSQAAKILQEKSYKQAEVQTSGNNLCFLFTGQGSQYPGMSMQLYETSPIFKDSFDKCDKVLQKRYNISIKNVLWSGEGNAEELSRTLYSQTSIFVVEYCLLQIWKSWGIKADYVMGHSLGEFAAAVAAGALNFEDALMLVAERSRLIDSLPRGKMLVIKADKKTVDATINAYKGVNPNFWVDYAALNSPEQTVVAGDSTLIEEFAKFCTSSNLKSIVLAATHAFHSRHMEPMLEAYRAVAMMTKKPEISDDLPKYISGMEGKLVPVEEVNADYWVKHTREKVSFMDACKVVQQEGCSLFLEVGPHPVLSALTARNLEGYQITCLPSIRRKEDDWTSMLDTLSKLYLSDWKGEIDWKGFDRFYNRQKVKLPFYPFNKKSTWLDVEGVSPRVHPLLGGIVPTASSETIYQSLITLKNCNFPQDHVIGNTVIFPGAGFLEMCLSGGHATVQSLTETMMKPRRPIVLKSLKIASPLALYESSVCKLQTLITLSDKEDDDAELGYSVAVHRQTQGEDGAGKWIQHATASFLPVAPTVIKEVSESIDIPSIQSNWEKSDNRDFYDKLPEVGLKFGPQFQSLECRWQSEKAMLASVKVPEDYQNYLIHPVVGDAMIQACMMWSTRSQSKRKLHVPVQVAEFTWLKEAESSTLFAYCTTDTEGDGRVYCILVDKSGTPLALMKGVDFVETTAKLVEGMITQQSTAMPKLWEDVWKNSRGPMQGYMEHKTPPEEQGYSEEDLKYFEEMNNVPEEEVKFYKNLVQITRLATLNAFYQLGWKPQKGEVFSVDGLMKSLKIKENFYRNMRFFIRSMTKPECGLLEAVDSEETQFKFIVEPPSIQEVQAGIKKTSSPNDVKCDEYLLIIELEKYLSKMLIGEVDPLSILFPKDSSRPSAGKFYDVILKTTSIRPFESRMMTHLKNAEKIYTKSSQCRPTYRILEVGSGTGAASKQILSKAASETCDIEYFYTDVSSAFFSAAEQFLEKYSKSVVFKRFDMMKDPLEQGLCPGYFDCVFGLEVFHIAKDMKKTMKSIRSLLKPGGLFMFEETIYPDERITFMFGLLEGYWHFEDIPFRKDHVTLTPEKWNEALTESGFYGVHTVPLYQNVHGFVCGYAAPIEENNFLKNLNAPQFSWLILGDDNDATTNALAQKISNVNRKTIIVPKPKQEKFEESTIQEYIKSNITSALEGVESIEGVVYLWALNPNTRDQTKISLPFMTLMKLVSEFKNPPRVFAVLKGANAMESSDTIDPAPGTLIGFCKSLSNENSLLSVTSVDLDPNKETLDQLDEVFMNLWVEHKQGFALRDGLRLRPRMTAAKIVRDESLPLPNGCDRFQLVLPKTKLISDLEFAYLEPYTIAENEVEIHVKAMALNFRDVLTVLKPISYFEKFNTVGLDYAGVVSKVGAKVTKLKVGDRVIGMSEFKDQLSLPSHVRADQGRAILLPKKMTFSEGVTLPVVFSTAVYCLINIAKMKKGETVLLHTASGGVGLAAIQLCKHVGATVIATAGSKRKRAYLKNLGIEHVFHSRTTDFKKDILDVTGGKGVDIVLNSITGPGFKEASLDSLNKNGRFIEMSKLNVWTPEEVKALRPDVFYKEVDLTALEKHENEQLNQQLQEFMDNDIIKPIPYERFDALNIRGALNYLQKAKHIGKILCVMPEVKLEKSSLVATTPLFNEESTYLITGGLGGIGYESAKWMLKNGAKHIVLVSRSSPKPDKDTQIEAWNKAGHHVQAFPVDIGDYEQCKQLLENLKKPESGFPQLRGVFHAAGVLHDAVLANQSWDTFKYTYNPKVNGSWNLHDLTKDYLLEHFVFFSSIAATIGSPGQTNHASSNAFEDSLGAYRISNGLPATCVNWGNWGEVGAAAEMDFPGVKPISTNQGLLALETFLKTQSTHIAVLNVDSFALVQKVFPQVKNYLDDQLLLGDSKSVVIMNSDGFWNEVDAATDREAKLACFKKSIRTVVRNILKMDADEPINDETEFQALGIDSLMMLEMKNGMQNILGGRMTITASQLKDSNNTEVMAKVLLDILEGDYDSEENIPSHEELKQLIRDDSNLLSEKLSVNGKKPIPIEQVETVLLTGATGNLGPYLLSDLTKRPKLKKVYCLIRPTAKISGKDRLKSRLEEMGITDTVDMTKVEVIEGDITSPKFGLDDGAYQSLCEKIEAVIHNAVKADHTALYWKAPESNKSHIRTANVLATARLLEFAAEETVKHFYYASTLLAFTGLGRDNKYTETWQDVSAFDSYKNAVKFGYLITKHICEQLLYHAIQKGLPCKAFRFPQIAGEGTTGRVDYLKNHAYLRWLACMKVGAIHDFPAPFPVIPVDQCAKISLDIFFHPEAPLDAYNMVQKTIETEQVLVDVARNFGIKLEVVPYDQFLDKLISDDDNSPIAPFKKMYEDGESVFSVMFDSPSALAFKKYLDEGADCLDTTNLSRYCQAYDEIVKSAKDVLIRDFTYIQKEGGFEKFGITTSS